MSGEPGVVLESAELVVYRLMTGGAWKENCYLMLHPVSSDMAIIDPGGNAKAILDSVSRLNGHVKYMLLTHAHHDHVGAAAELSAALELPATVHARERQLLRLSPTYAMVFAGVRQRPVTSVQDLSVDSPLELGAVRIEVVETPGHSPGGVCYLTDRCVFTGDTVLPRSIGRTDLPGADHSALVSSVNRVCESVSPDALVCPGHGDPFRLGAFSEWWRENRTAPAEYREPVKTNEPADAVRLGP